MSDLAQLAADFARAAVTIGEVARPVLQASAERIREEWRHTWPWSGSTHLPYMTRAGPGLGMRVSYNTKVTPVGAEAEIGPRKEGAGALANLIEFGSINNSPHPGGAPALAKEAPRFEAELVLIAQALTLGALVREHSVPSRFNVKGGDRGTGTA